VAIATVLAALAAAGFGADESISIRTPAGWYAWTPRTTTQGVTNPALRRELLGPDGTVVQVRELVSPLLTRGSLEAFPPRPRHFDVRTFRQTAGCILPGSVGTRFRARGRAFYVVVQHPTAAVGTVLDTLRVHPR
jgi:hypothetical protein